MASDDDELGLGVAAVAVACGVAAYATQRLGSGDVGLFAGAAWWFVSGATGTLFFDSTVGRVYRTLRRSRRENARRGPVRVSQSGFAGRRPVDTSTRIYGGGSGAWIDTAKTGLRGGVLVAAAALGAHALATTYSVPLLTDFVFEVRNFLGLPDGYGERGQPLNDVVVVVAAPADGDTRMADVATDILNQHGWIASPSDALAEYSAPEPTLYFAPGFSEEATYLAEDYGLIGDNDVLPMPEPIPTSVDGQALLDRLDEPGGDLDGAALLLLLGAGP